MSNNNQSVKIKVYANAGNPEILKHIPKDGSYKILDVGCGAGDNARHLTRVGHEIDGVTLSEEEAKHASAFCGIVSVHNLESGLPEVLVEKKYDYVICSHVLEHICFPERLLADIQKCLKRDGKLIVALPNLMFIRSRCNILRGRFCYTKSGIMDNTHFRWYTFATAADLLRSNGFSPVLHYATGFFPLGPVRRHFPNISSSLDRLLCKHWPGMFGLQIVILASR